MKPLQLAFLQLDPAELEPYFDKDGTDPLTADEIKKGLAGLFRTLGRKGKLAPDAALAIARAYSASSSAEVSVASIELVKAQTELVKLKVEKLAEELNKTSFPKPTNDYEPKEPPK